ncbi:lysozyme [Nitratireductor sp. B36]|uniref:glycoside hydrolase family protein n=1 Tax=Nitratireductor sp. B36 TaxID=2762059 RepID=UPI001E3736D9|nr:glycoside hydrolase family protein [Nitratireductor sp. B36]MCC5780771.1 lysozyme [Nitratireductor sp. B36]
MQSISPKGIEYLESAEGVVLKAYRDPVGIWTIGGGLTAASGVVTPRAGMVITRKEASRLLALALKRNYEPRVRKALGRVAQHVFDGSTSFDYNTGAIHRASWVKAFRNNNPAKARAKIMLWVKGGGRVLPGLKRRRREEADIILLDKWPAHISIARNPAKPNVAFAGVAIALTPGEIDKIAEGFRSIGYDPGTTPGRISLIAVSDFQRKYDLTVDGVIGKATLSTLQRELDARKSAKKGAGGAAGGAVVAGGGEAVSPGTSLPDPTTLDPALLKWIGAVGGAIAGVYLLYLAWHYRDMIAARIANHLPRTAKFLRSF